MYMWRGWLFDHYSTLLYLIIFSPYKYFFSQLSAAVWIPKSYIALLFCLEATKRSFECKTWFEIESFRMLSPVKHSSLLLELLGFVKGVYSEGVNFNTCFLYCRCVYTRAVPLLQNTFYLEGFFFLFFFLLHLSVKVSS